MFAMIVTSCPPARKRSATSDERSVPRIRIDEISTTCAICPAVLTSVDSIGQPRPKRSRSRGRSITYHSSVAVPTNTVARSSSVFARAVRVCGARGNMNSPVRIVGKYAVSVMSVSHCSWREWPSTRSSVAHRFVDTHSSR